jgi:hypothetical protein
MATSKLVKNVTKVSAPKRARASVKTEAAERMHEIARRAYERWQARGCVHGFDVEDWLAAERELS